MLRLVDLWFEGGPGSPPGFMPVLEQSITTGPCSEADARDGRGIDRVGRGILPNGEWSEVVRAVPPKPHRANGFVAVSGVVQGARVHDVSFFGALKGGRGSVAPEACAPGAAPWRRVPQATKRRPWRCKSVLAFTERDRALAFERYLKSPRHPEDAKRRPEIEDLRKTSKSGLGMAVAIVAGGDNSRSHTGTPATLVEVVSTSL